MRKFNFITPLIPAILLASVFFFVTNDYYISVLTFILFHAVNATGFNILLGYTGIISLGQAAFFGIGAYTAGILSVQFMFEPVLGIIAGALLAAVVALIIGYPSLKLHGHYLAMATLGFGMIVNILLNEMEFITGGPSGLVGIDFFNVMGKWTIMDDMHFFPVIAGLFVLLVVLFELFDKSHVSYTLKFIRSSESASAAYGINVFRTKLTVFVAVAALTAANGGLFAYYTSFISPVSFGLKYSISLMAMATVGGLGSISGGIIGALVLSLLPEFFANLEDYEMIIYGVCMAVSIMFFPKGLAGLFSLKRREDA